MRARIEPRFLTFSGRTRKTYLLCRARGRGETAMPKKLQGKKRQAQRRKNAEARNEARRRGYEIKRNLREGLTFEKFQKSIGTDRSRGQI